MTKTVIFVGSITRSYIDFLNSEGLVIGAFPEAGGNKYFDENGFLMEKWTEVLDFVVPLNFDSSKTIQEGLKSVYFRPSTTLIWSHDNYVYPAAIIANTLNLNQKKEFSVDLAKASTNKLLQRKLFQDNYPEITVPFKKVRTFHSAYMFSRKVGFPLISKPVNLAGSRLVAKSDNLEEYIQNVSYALDNVDRVYKQDGVHRLPQIMIEKYVSGQLYSVDSYVDGSGNIRHTEPCREKTGYDVGRTGFQIDVAEYLGEVDDQLRESILEATVKAIKSLGIKNNVVHTEIKVDGDHYKIIELNLRPGGGRAVMLHAAYGINHIKNVVDSILGKEVEVKNELQKYTIKLNLWAKEAGYLKEVRGLDELKSLDSFISSTLPNTKKLIGPASQEFQKTMSVTLAHVSKDKVLEDLEKARGLVDFVVTED